MNSSFPMMPLSEVLTQYKEYIDAPEPKIYRKLSVKLYGKGVVLDTSVDGATLKMKRHQIAKSGQVILSEIWGKKGAIGLVPQEGDGALCTSHFFIFDVKFDKIDSRYLQAIFEANYLQPQLEKPAKGTTGYAAVRPKHLLSAKIPLPRLEEQEHIVKKLESLMKRIEEARRLRTEAAKEVKKLILSKVKHIIDSHRPSIRPENSDKKYEWAWLGIPEFVSEDKYAFKRGPFGSSLRKEFFVPSGFRVYEQKNVIMNNFSIGDYYINQDRFEKLKAFEIQEDDVLITCSGTIGKVAVVPEGIERGIINQALLKITLNKSIMLPEFFKIVFESDFMKSELSELSPGSAMKNITSVKELKKLVFPVPTLLEQRHILSYLESLRKKTDELEELMNETEGELEELVSSILERAFKGELL